MCRAKAAFGKSKIVDQKISKISDQTKSIIQSVSQSVVVRVRVEGIFRYSFTVKKKKEH